MWAFLSLPAFGRSTRSGESITHGQWIVWLVLFFSFAPAFWISSSLKPRPLWIRVVALVAQTGCVLGMTAIVQDYLVGFLLVVVSWQVAILLPVRAAIVWAVADSSLWVFFQEPHYHLGWRWSATGALLGFQSFAIIAATIAKNEATAREDQARINAELVSTRELLRESSKAGERIRITRELHDVVGHHLTALCLHLETALHLSSGQVEIILEKAQSMAKQLLTEVRTLVSGFHENEHIDLRGALEALERNVPRITLMIQMPDDLGVTDAVRAHAVLRCVQEITTNTLKHSDAKHLSIYVNVREGAIEIEARDDGTRVEQNRTGIGISTMRQRLEELGGGVAVDATPHKGFHLRAWLPARDAVEVR